MRVTVRVPLVPPEAACEREGLRFSQACYVVDSVACSVWRPLVAAKIVYPKANGYQSLHRAVLVPSLTLDVGDGQPDAVQRALKATTTPIELQIRSKGRTLFGWHGQRCLRLAHNWVEGVECRGPAPQIVAEMHARAESGEAAHIVQGGHVNGAIAPADGRTIRYGSICYLLRHQGGPIITAAAPPDSQGANKVSASRVNPSSICELCCRIEQVGPRRCSLTCQCIKTAVLLIVIGMGSIGKAGQCRGGEKSFIELYEATALGASLEKSRESRVAKRQVAMPGGCMEDAVCPPFVLLNVACK